MQRLRHHRRIITSGNLTTPTTESGIHGRDFRRCCLSSNFIQLVVAVIFLHQTYLYWAWYNNTRAYTLTSNEAIFESYSAKLAASTVGGLAESVDDSSVNGMGSEDVNSDNCTLTSPRQFHLAVGRNASTSMTISFSVPLDCHPSIFNAAVIYWEEEKEARLQQSKLSDVKQFNYTSLQQPQLFYESPYLHHVHLDGLIPHTSYKYVCVVYLGHLDITRMVEKHRTSSLSFRTAPFPKRKSQSEVDTVSRFIVVGDLGSQNFARNTLDLMLKERKDLIVCTGDIAYARSGEDWGEWFEMFQGVLSSTPFMPVPGNHDVERDATNFELFSNYEFRFAMPQARPAIKLPGTNSTPISSALNWYGTYDYGNSFFSYSAGLVTFIHLNSYTESKPGSRQYKFVSRILRNIDRLVTPWVIIIAHCPFYSPYRHHDKEVQAISMKLFFEALFVKYKVNVVFSGHVHAYARSKHVSMDKVDYNRAAPMYILNGDGGRKPLINIKSKSNLLQDAFNTSNDAFDARNNIFETFDSDNNAFLVVVVLNTTHIRLKRVLSTEGKKGQIWEDVFLFNQYYL